MILAALMAAALAQPPRQYTQAEIDDLRRAESRALLWGQYRDDWCGWRNVLVTNRITLAVLLEKRVRTDMALGITAADLQATEPETTCAPKAK